MKAHLHFKKLATLAIAALGFVTTANAQRTNLAALRPSISSPYEAPFVAASANDVDTAVGGTRWSSDFVDNAWWQVNLGTVQKVKEVVIKWETASAASYLLQLSNDSTFATSATIATVNNRPAGVNRKDYILTDSTVTGKYLRMQGVSRTTPYGYSMWDLAVYNQLLTPTSVKPTLNSLVKFGPNPSANNFTFSNLDGFKNVTVTDVTGRAIYTAPVKGNSITIGNNWPAGLYVVTLTHNNGQVAVQRVTKQ